MRSPRFKIACTLLIAAAIPALAACSDQGGAGKAGEAAAPKSGITLTYRDTKVKPGDDFDAFANGAWREATAIPPDRSSTGVGFEVGQRAERRNAELVRDAGAGHPANGTPQRMIADYYAAYMDKAGLRCGHSSPRSTRSLPRRTSPARSAAGCAPTSMRSTTPISGQRICSACG
jgi:putative endopeptidase